MAALGWTHTVGSEALQQLDMLIALAKCVLNIVNLQILVEIDKIPSTQAEATPTPVRGPAHGQPLAPVCDADRTSRLSDEFNNPLDSDQQEPFVDRE